MHWNISTRENCRECPWTRVSKQELYSFANHKAIPAQWNVHMHGSIQYPAIPVIWGACEEFSCQLFRPRALDKTSSFWHIPIFTAVRRIGFSKPFVPWIKLRMHQIKCRKPCFQHGELASSSSIQAPAWEQLVGLPKNVVMTVL
jgi:hypothetical protein